MGLAVHNPSLINLGPEGLRNPPVIFNMLLSINFSRGAALFAALALAACKERPISVYTVPKVQAAEEKPAPHAPHEGHTDDEDHAVLPNVKWTLPAGWKDMGPDSQGGPVKAVGRFTVEGSDAMVNITPLGSFSGKEPVLVNMWRSVFALEPLADEEAAKALTDIPVAGGVGKIFDLTGDQRGKKSRIVTAMFTYAGQSWFFKLQGSPEAVEPQVAAFKQFLTTIQFEAAPPPVAPPPVAPPPAPAPADAPQVALPAGWAALTPGPMQVGKFSVPEKDGAKAEVTVSVFPSDTGGTLSNINRWRSQVGLPAVDEAGLATCTAPLDAALPGALLADLKGESKHMLGAIVPREGQYFFYKLTGDAAAVSAAREAFVAFIKTAK